MATLPAESAQDSGSKLHTYSRKQKSLGLLCTNFLGLYSRPGIESIGLDDAANNLGVERRRIYDIVNVLESVGVLVRKAKNQYSWKGFHAISKALEDLKAEGLRDCDEGEMPISGSQNSNPIGSQQSNNTGSQPDSSTSSNKDNKREKSLGLLTKNFVKLFLCTDAELISLDDAARSLLGDGHHSAVMRAKVRRLYDIANVLSSLHLIEKTHHSETRKPAFRWLGLKKTLETDFSSVTPVVFEVKKRAFGMDLTNVSSKKAKVDLSTAKHPKRDMSFHVKAEIMEHDINTDNAVQDIKPSSRIIQFGPFAPAVKASAPEKKGVMQLQELETLASSYRPQYQNQAVKELFDHYVDAWKSWIFEVSGEKQLEQVL